MMGTERHPAPDKSLYVVGDIHGRVDLLDTLLELIERDRRDRGTGEAVTMFLGDYVDRGPDTDGVLARLRSLCDLAEPGAICLMGNHERMMLDFLEDPASVGPVWLRNGGRETLLSFDIDDPSAEDMPAHHAELAARLRAALPAGTEDWLRALPLWHRDGNVVCVHAGMNALRRPEDQDPRALLWGRGSFLTWPRLDRLWVVHGHTVVPKPTLRHRRIAVDTGAWFSGRLTAAVLHPGAPVRFMEAVQ